MAGIIHRKPGLILPGSPEWQDPHLCDVVNTADMMAGGESCAFDPQAANRVSFIRGKYASATGSQPGTDDIGVGLNWKYFSQQDQMGSQAFITQDGMSKWADYASSSGDMRSHSRLSVSAGSPVGSFAVSGWLRFNSGTYGGNSSIMSGNGSSAFTIVMINDGYIGLSQFGAPQGAIIKSNVQPPFDSFFFFTCARDQASGNAVMTFNGSVVGTASGWTGNAGSYGLYADVPDDGRPWRFNDLTVYNTSKYMAAFTPPSTPPC